MTDECAKQSLKEDCLDWSSLPVWASTSSLEIPTSSAMMAKTFSDLQAESIMSSSVEEAGKFLINDFRCAYHFALAIRLCRLCAGLCIDMIRLESLHQKRPYRRLPSCVPFVFLQLIIFRPRCIGKMLLLIPLPESR